MKNKKETAKRNALQFLFANSCICQTFNYLQFLGVLAELLDLFAVFVPCLLVLLAIVFSSFLDWAKTLAQPKRRGTLVLVIIIGKKKLFYSSMRLPHFTYQGV